MNRKLSADEIEDLHRELDCECDVAMARDRSGEPRRMTKDNNSALCQLLERAEDLAIQRADGHITIMRFTTGWKVMLGTPEMTVEFSGQDFAITGGGRGDVQKIQPFKRFNRSKVCRKLWSR